MSEKTLITDKDQKLDMVEKKRNSWNMFLSHHNDWASKLRNERLDSSNSSSSSTSHDIETYLFAALSPNPQSVIGRGRDLNILKKTVSSLLEAMEEDILTEKEANALLEFIVAKFIEKRFDGVLQNVFNVETRQHYKLRRIRGVIK